MPDLGDLTAQQLRADYRQWSPGHWRHAEDRTSSRRSCYFWEVLEWNMMKTCQHMGILVSGIPEFRVFKAVSSMVCCSQLVLFLKEWISRNFMQDSKDNHDFKNTRPYRFVNNLKCNINPLTCGYFIIVYLIDLFLSTSIFIFEALNILSGGRNKLCSYRISLSS